MTLSQLPFYLINAFAPTLHGGNQAAVVVFDSPTDPRANDDEYMRLLARDFNFSETAYVVPSEQPGVFGLRWFTPTEEIALCGHATLATSHVLFDLHPELAEVQYNTRWAGTLGAKRAGEKGAEIKLPSLPPSVLSTFGQNVSTSGEKGQKLVQDTAGALGVLPDEIKAIEEVPFGGLRYMIIELDSGSDIEGQTANIKALLRLASGLIIVTQLSNETIPGHLPINTRVYAPGLGVDEDPVCGSGHAFLTGYFLASPRSTTLPEHIAKDPLNTVLLGHQLSSRRGELRCTWDNGSVRLAGPSYEFGRGLLSRDL